MRKTGFGGSEGHPRLSQIAAGEGGGGGKGEEEEEKMRRKMRMGPKGNVGIGEVF